MPRWLPFFIPNFFCFGNYEIDDYVRKLQNYANDAQDYANCEIRSLDY